ncbi:hypothetical protein F2Q69_00043500 [Brassica cretica]|uniref:DUF1985 domain-containing protein n=1 Tax=Brassica cretica TaxID=69181 RepID=A0A8S9N3A1_BRACR|nr:hypothetical protein F2Q69_00043500 [Brassica cretica]
MDIYVHKLQYSGRVIHSFVCKQLLTAKRHELWFHFARRALRFSMQEFHAITGLKYKDDESDLDIDNWRGDKGFWSKLLRRKGKISLQQRMRRDKVKTQNSYAIDGFFYALQNWLMEAIPDIGSLLGKKLKEGVTSMRCRNWKGTAKVSCEDIISIESDFASTGVVFPYISSTGNGNIIIDAGFEQNDEMNDERVDLIIDMYKKKYDWSKHVWGYQETEQPYADSSEDDGSKEEAAGERSDCGMEEEIETAHVSPTKKRKNQYQDIGTESRKKRLLCQRSTDKYRDLEEGMKSYIQGMFKSSFTALGLEDPELSDVFGSLFDNLDFNLGTQEHLQKTMGNLTQESHVKGFDPSQEIFNRPFLNDKDDPEIGPSKFDAELASRIMGPNEWLKNNDMDAMMYLFREKTSLHRWKPNRVAFMNCMFSNQIITAYGKFDGNRRGYKVDNNLLEYGLEC